MFCRLLIFNLTKNLIPMTRILQGWTITNGIGILWSDGTVDQLLLDEPNLYFPDATDVVVTPDGRYALVTSSGSDRVAVVRGAIDFGAVQGGRILLSDVMGLEALDPRTLAGETLVPGHGSVPPFGLAVDTAVGRILAVDGRERTIRILGRR